MGAGRPKYNFYAVSNGKEVGIYTNWTQASDSVLGFANAKYKGYTTYSEAKSAMESAGLLEYVVFDGQVTITKADYEKQLGFTSEKNNSASVSDNETIQGDNALVEVIYREQEMEEKTVYIDGSCIRNESDSAKAGYGVYWGVDHPWNGSYTMPKEEGATNNKAELRAAIKAIEIAEHNQVEKLVINSDSKYVVQGITQWSDNWCKNGWKTSNGESVKNKEEWVKLLQLVNDSKITIKWNHVPGHKGISGNEEADKLAVKGANNQGTKPKCTEALNREDSSSGLKVQPNVIVIGKIPEHHQKDKKTADEPLSFTPRRKHINDRSDTPVPGCINGSSIDKSTVNVNEKKCRGQDTPSIANDQFFRVMKNVETVLETVLLGVNQSREENLQFKMDVAKKLDEITAQQIRFEESLSSIRKDLQVETQDVNGRMQLAQASISVADNLKLNQDVTRKLDEVTSKLQKTTESQSTMTKELISDKKNINCRLDGLKSSLHTVEMTCSDLKQNLDKASTVNKKGCDEIQSVGKQIYEAITEVRTESKRTREQVVDIEKGISAISEAGMFTSNSKLKKSTDNLKDNTHTELPQNQNREKDESGDEVEITFAKVVSKDTNVSQGVNSDSTDKTETPVGRQTNELNRTGSQQGKPGNRKEKVCLIGDSIAGQVNVPALGKSTNTYVRRLKAPKINEVGSFNSEVKDAKLIIIHTGVNNLRDKESTESCTNSMVTVITNLRETAPDAKIVVSKITPVGDRELSIESTMLNASCEKKLREIHKDIQFIDHSNLADQGRPIKTHYKPDMLHLSYNGVIIFGSNLRKVIAHSLNKNESTNTGRDNDKSPERGSIFPGKSYWYDRRGRDAQNFDRHRDGQYDNTDRLEGYDRRRRYDKQYGGHKDGFDKYTDRANSERNDDRRERDYYYSNEQRYDDRYDEYSRKDNRYFDHKDNGYSYHRDYDRGYYRH